MPHQQMHGTDLVVVGCGIAGLSAAASAVQQGLRVTVLERAAKEEYGGNTRWTESYMRMKNEHEVSDDFETIFAENAGYNIDLNILAAMAGPYEQWPGIVRAHGLPDPDLLIRTSGELRLSNFLLWQSAYTEFVFLDAFWPDFGRELLEQAIDEFRSRVRRFGGVVA